MNVRLYQEVKSKYINIAGLKEKIKNVYYKFEPILDKKEVKINSSQNQSAKSNSKINQKLNENNIFPNLTNYESVKDESCSQHLDHQGNYLFLRILA